MSFLYILFLLPLAALGQNCSDTPSRIKPCPLEVKTEFQECVKGINISTESSELVPFGNHSYNLNKIEELDRLQSCYRPLYDLNCGLGRISPIFYSLQGAFLESFENFVGNCVPNGKVEEAQDYCAANVQKKEGECLMLQHTNCVYERLNALPECGGNGEPRTGGIALIQLCFLQTEYERIKSFISRCAESV